MRYGTVIVSNKAGERRMGVTSAFIELADSPQEKRTLWRLLSLRAEVMVEREASMAAAPLPLASVRNCHRFPVGFRSR
jgi:hypothetical protein